MPTDRTRLPLPDEFLMHPTQGECYTLNQLRAYSDAENAALRAELEEWRFTNRVDELDRHVTRLSARVKQLEDALRNVYICIGQGGGAYDINHRTMPIIRAALAQPTPAAPAVPAVQPLTDTHIGAIALTQCGSCPGTQYGTFYIRFARAIEQAHGIAAPGSADHD